MAFQDIICEKADGIATITMNRPEVLNAFRGQTVDEMIEAFRDAWHDRTIGVVILTGAGEPCLQLGRRPISAQRRRLPRRDERGGAACDHP